MNIITANLLLDKLDNQLGISIQNLFETGDASCEKIPHREPALECLRRAE
jgi:hypothetical protein